MTNHVGIKISIGVVVFESKGVIRKHLCHLFLSLQIVLRLFNE